MAESRRELLVETPGPPGGLGLSSRTAPGSSPQVEKDSPASTPVMEASQFQGLLLAEVSFSHRVLPSPTSFLPLCAKKKGPSWLFILCQHVGALSALSILRTPHSDRTEPHLQPFSSPHGTDRPSPPNTQPHLILLPWNSCPLPLRSSFPKAASFYEHGSKAASSENPS